MSTLRVGAVILMSTAVLLVTGCAKGAGLNTSGVERAVTEKLTVAYKPLKVGATKCPSKVSLEKGTTFTCETEVAGSMVGVKVTTTDDAGAIRFETTKAVLQIWDVQRDLEAKLHAAYDEPGDVLDIKAQCNGLAVRVLAVGSTFRCDVTVSAEKMVQEVTVEDATGNVTYRAVS